MTKRRKNKSRFLLIGSFLAFIGLSIFAGYNIFNYYSNKNDEKIAEDFIEELRVQEEKVVDADNQNVENKTDYKVESKINYIGVLEIPAINFKRGFFDVDNTQNIVDKNIEVLNNSDMPNVTNGILAIAGHSGSGRTAYFKNLYKLNVDDEIYVYYGNARYIYKVNKSYEVDKNGIIDITRDIEKTTLVLTTCSKDKTKQIVILAYLTDKENF